MKLFYADSWRASSVELIRKPCRLGTLVWQAGETRVSHSETFLTSRKTFSSNPGICPLIKLYVGILPSLLKCSLHVTSRFVLITTCKRKKWLHTARRLFLFLVLNDFLTISVFFLEFGRVLASANKMQNVWKHLSNGTLRKNKTCIGYFFENQFRRTDSWNFETI